MSDSLPSDAPKPRLCHLRKWTDFNGYGFNLHAERGKAGQFIGTVDEQSPAVAAKLRSGDRIIEVNGTNIGSENHQQVVQRIKAVPDETRLLVVDEEADNYYKEHKVVVRGDMDNIDYCETPTINPFTNQTTEPETTETEALMNEVKISETGETDDVAAQAKTADEPVHVDCVARLCHLKIWPDFAGYGFNLHADRATPGQYVGKVDEDSPAEAAGLRLNDRIVQVNGHSVEGRSHGEVVGDIKSVIGEVRLLVIDSATDEYCHTNRIKVSSASFADIQTIVCPDSRPDYPAVNGEEEASVSVTQAEQKENSFQENVEVAAPSVPEPEPVDTTSDSQQAGATVNVGDPASPLPAISTPASQTPSSAPGAGQPVVVGGIQFAGSAKEARERMKKKSNVKQDQGLSLRDKYEMLQKM